MTRKTTLLCFAHGNAEGWEAICVDLDIAVQGQTLTDAQALLERSIGLYVASAMEEEPETRRLLMNRRAPFATRFVLTLRLLAFNIFNGRQREAQASFPILCHA